MYVPAAKENAIIQTSNDYEQNVIHISTYFSIYLNENELEQFSKLHLKGRFRQNINIFLLEGRVNVL